MGKVIWLELDIFLNVLYNFISSISKILKCSRTSSEDENCIH